MREPRCAGVCLGAHAAPRSPHAPGPCYPSAVELERRLHGFTLWRDAGDAGRAAIAAVATASSAVEGERLWAEGDPADRVILVCGGLVQIVRRTAQGDEMSIGLFGPRECIGLAAALDGSAYPADAVVVSEQASLIALPAAPLVAAAAADPALGRALTSALLAHTRALHAKIAMITSGDTAQRLAVLFGHLAERFGDELADGATVIPLALTRRMLGQLVGARTETVIRIVSRWQQAGALATGPEGFVIRDLAALTA